MKEEILCKVQMQITSIVQSEYFKKNNIMKTKNMIMKCEQHTWIKVKSRIWKKTGTGVKNYSTVTVFSGVTIMKRNNK